jgi:type IV pilus assembly protein PilV
MLKTPPRRRPRFACRGASLLEAMVALVIFSVGILGLLGLQANALSTTRDAQYRAEAAVLADEIIGVMWSDRVNADFYVHNGSGGTLCAPTASATTYHNALAWLGEFTTTSSPRYLPGATSAAQQISVDGDRTVRVTICWRAPQDAGWHNYTAVAQIPE